MGRLVFSWPLVVAVGLALGSAAGSRLSAGEIRSTPAQNRAWDAVKNGDRVGLQKEIDAGVELNLPDNPEVSFLALAIDSNQPDMIPLLVKGGANLSWRSPKDYPLLLRAVMKNSPQSVTALLDAGAAVDIVGGTNPDGTKQGMTALSHAASMGSLEIVKILVARGANLNFVDALNGTPVGRAWHKKHEEVARYLEGFGATDVQEDARANPLVVKSQAAPVKKTTTAAPTTTPSSTGTSGSGSGSSTASATTKDTGLPGTGLFGSSQQPTRPARPARPIYEVTVGNVLGGPLSPLWSSFQGKHPEWGLDSQGHKTRLGNGVKMTGGSRIDSLPSEWAAELYQIGVDQGLIAGNAKAPYLVAPLGGYAAVAAQEEQARLDEVRKEEADKAASTQTRTSTQTGTDPGSQSQGRPQ